ncbi:hypothetical protein H9I45_15010 [Polaribacter haliotis]|uniref:Uncharacterized protein n=1 Tax=Polaribacter haliotis TaxID=1888915 RepID=A0A7L8AF40_9FLAO|nr:hypothetical protein [Polaribacter haliotis]QOD60628.1 hypothetical protein H9I45_15010 [Polaribacter haliotis]
MQDNKKKIQGNNDFWDIKKAGNRLLWRFSEDKNGKMQNFTPNDADKLALKSVLSFINKQTSGIIERHNVYAKLYIMQLVGDIRRHGTTVFNDSVFAELSHKLSKPLELYYTTFYEDLASNQLNRLAEGTFTTKEGEAIVMDYQRFKDTFPLDLVKSKINDRMIATLHRRS